MKKKITLALLLSGLFFTRSNAQVSFSTSTETYTNLTGAKQLMKDTAWDEMENDNAARDLVIPLGFNFKYNGFVHDTLFLYDVNLVGNDFTTIFGPAIDMCDRGIIAGKSKSPIFIKRDGVSPNRIVKIEWRNAGFYDELDANSSLNDSITAQIWFYENGNKFEYHTGPSNIAGTFPDYLQFISVGIWAETPDPSAILDGASNAPTLITDLTTATGLDDYPSSGRVYTFAADPNYSFLPKTQPAQSIVYYNNDNLFSKSSKTENFRIFSVDGKLVMQGKFENNSANLTKLAAGTYVAITNAGVLKFVKE